MTPTVSPGAPSLGGRLASGQVAPLGLDAIDRRLLNDFQSGLPLSSRPFAALAESLGIGETEVIERLRRLTDSGAVSRVGPVFRPKRVGVSTLAAMSVPPDRLESVAAMVNTYAEVNHNYEREHRFNLWFVLTAADQPSLALVLAEIAARAGLPVLDLPMLAEYHIDLGFQAPMVMKREGAAPVNGDPEIALDAALIRAIQGGVPLVERPYAAIAAAIGISEASVLERLAQLLEDGSIKRLGVVVRHQELGYRSNAMVVWDLPDDRVDGLGERIGALPFVTLCYRRPRHLPEWPYNLFTMIHGRNRASVLAQVETIKEVVGLGSVPCAALFSGRRFKQRGAQYRQTDLAGEAMRAGEPRVGSSAAQGPSESGPTGSAGPAPRPAAAAAPPVQWAAPHSPAT